MFEQHAGHKLICEKSFSSPHPTTQTPGTFQFPSQYRARDPARVPVYSWSVQVFGPSPWRVGQIYPMPAQCTLLLHVGWGQCGHGLSSRPNESRDMKVMHSLLGFFGYPEGAGTELESGTLKLRYSSAPSPKDIPLGRFLILPEEFRWLLPALFPRFIFWIVNVQ